MVDETKIVLDFLLAQDALKGFAFWADVAEPVAGYKPADGVGICFKARGGNDDDTNVVFDPSFQFLIFGIDEVTCRDAAHVLHDVVEGRGDAHIMAIRRETYPVTLKDPQTNWTHVLVHYKIMVR